MDLTYSFAIGFAFSQVVLALVLLAFAGFKTIQQKLFALLMVTIASYLFVNEFSGTKIELLVSALRTAVPGVFWLFNASIFDDNFKLRIWKVGLVLLTVLLPLVAGLLSVESFDVPLRVFPQYLEFVLLGLALFAVARHWQVDLLESRRRLRIWFCGFNGGYLFTLIFFQQVLFPGADWLRDYQYVSAAIALFATNLLLLKLGKGLFDFSSVSTIDLSTQTPAESQNIPVMAEVSPEFIEHLRVVMEDERFYAEMGLTIGQLAAKLDIQEYKLRQMINSQLGYRNFNDFLNSYRIKETAARLLDSNNDKLPILTIALDVGFRSLSSFNKAFKDTYGQTPTAYRKASKA